MTKHVSSGDDKAQASQRDAATESLPTQTGTDDDAQALSQGAAGGHPVEAMAPDVAADAVVDAASGADRRSERNDARGNQTAPAATASAARTAAAASSTADTRLAGAWTSPDAQNAATIGVAGSASDSAKKARAKARGPWYRRRAVVGLPGWRCWRARSGPDGALTHCLTTAVTPVVITLSASPETARVVLVGRAVLEARCPVVVPVGARAAPVGRAVREEAPVEPAGPRPTATRPVDPERVMATRRAAPAPPPGSSSSRTPPRARRAERATVEINIFFRDDAYSCRP